VASVPPRGAAAMSRQSTSEARPTCYRAGASPRFEAWQLASDDHAAKGKLLVNLVGRAIEDRNEERAPTRALRLGSRGAQRRQRFDTYLERSDLGRHLAGEIRAVGEGRGNPAEDARAVFEAYAEYVGFGGGKDKLINAAFASAIQFANAGRPVEVRVSSSPIAGAIFSFPRTARPSRSTALRSFGATLEDDDLPDESIQVDNTNGVHATTRRFHLGGCGRKAGERFGLAPLHVREAEGGARIARARRTCHRSSTARGDDRARTAPDTRRAAIWGPP
jgi:hypothetical protein